MLRRLMMANSSTPPLVEYIGATGMLNQTGSSVLMSAPIGAIAGDMLIACVTCRGDRDISATSGWTQLSDIRSGTNTQSTRVKVFSREYNGTSVQPLAHSANAAYGAVISAVRGGTIKETSYDQSATDATSSISPPEGVVLVGFGALNPRSTSGGVVPIGSQPDWDLQATGAYVTSQTLINYMVMAYSSSSSTPSSIIRVGTEYGTESNRVGTVWQCAIY